MRSLYSLALYCSLPIILLILFVKGLRNNDYWRRIPERFGFTLLPGTDNRPTISIHAVSVGEVNATKPIVSHLLDHYPDHSIIITTMTPAGTETVHQNYGNKVRHCYLPYDFPGAIKRFLAQVRPQLQIVMETEIWPNWFYRLRQYGIPILLINARMSGISIKGYLKFKPLIQSTLLVVDRIAAQTHADAERFIHLGVHKDKIEVTGNLKFSVPLPRNIPSQGQALRKRLSAHRPVWIAASTHAGEEEIILDAYQQIQRAIRRCLLIIAPRHIERTEQIVHLCKKHNYSYVKKTDSSAYSNDTQVYILNTLGELIKYYAAADVAFVGGSLVNVGGHNVLEPVSIGVPTITGPYTHNFVEINEQLQVVGVVSRVSNTGELAAKVIGFLTDTKLIYKVGRQGKHYIRQNQGNADKVLSIIASYLNRL